MNTNTKHVKFHKIIYYMVISQHVIISTYSCMLSSQPKTLNFFSLDQIPFKTLTLSECWSGLEKREPKKKRKRRPGIAKEEDLKY
ncbi:unnamed protein product [Arctogadus glacialis]